MAVFQVIDLATGIKENIIECDPAHPMKMDGKRIEPDDGRPVWTPAPESCSPVQFRIACRRLGMKPAFDAFLIILTDEQRDVVEYTIEVRRAHPLIQAAQAYCNWTTEQVDNLFRLAVTIN